MNRSIDKIGNLIAVCGNSGSGKSTLVRNALSQLPEELLYMKTLTTRVRRPVEDDIEYTFVNDSEYEQHRQSANVWDESTIYGNRYAVNASEYIEALYRGKNVIFCSIPSREIMDNTRKIYGATLLSTIQLMTGSAMSAEQARARDSSIDIGRVTLDAAMNTNNKFDADYNLIPSGSLRIDQMNFLSIIRSIIL